MRSRSAFQNRKQRGVSLVFTLLVLTAMTAIVASFAASQRISAQGVARRIEAVRARRMAESGLARALAEMATQDTTRPALLTDPWATLGQGGAERFLVGNDSFRFQVLDAGSFVNLNTASQEQLFRLPLTTEQIDSLLDWREAGVAPRQEGAKDEYYTQLPSPYIAAMKALLSFDELLLVKGFDMTTLYEPPTEERPNPNYIPGNEDEQLSLYDLATVESQAPEAAAGGQTKLNINNAQLQQIVQRGVPQATAQAIINRRNNGGTFVNLGQVFSVPMPLNVAATILDNFVVGGAQVATGRVNINTAPNAVLATLPGISQDIAEAISSRQNVGYQTLGELTTVPGVDTTVLQQMAHLVTTHSQMYLVRVIGYAGRSMQSIQALVTLGDAGPVVVKRVQPPFYDMSTRWRWSAETTADVVVWESR